MWERSELKRKAKNVLNTTYWNSVLVCFILSMIGGVGARAGVSNSSESEDSSYMKGLEHTFRQLSSGQILGILAVVAAVVIGASIIGLVLRIFVLNPVEVGAMRYFMESREQKSSVGCLGYAFKGNYMNIVLTMVLKGVYTWLWSLLFVIPGIIKSYEYRMIPYILAENPQISHQDAFRLSREMMDGEKWDAFVLDLSFILWCILGAITCGLALVFYVAPYMQHTDAELYAVLREKVLMSGASNTYELKGFGNDTVPGGWNGPL